MFREFFRFEIFYWLRGLMIYIFLGVIALLFGVAAGSDQVQVGGAIGNTMRNAPFVIQQYYAIAGLLTGLMIAAVYDSCASRDFAYKMSDLIFSKPIHKWHYLLGRFSAATLIASIPTLGISLGIILAGWNPWRDPERWVGIHWEAHFVSFLMFGLPNTLLVGSIVFAIAVWTRNTMYSFLGVLILLVGYSISQALLSDLSNESWGTYLDPFGISPFSVLTKYWTVDQRNHMVISLAGPMIVNRALWIAISMAIFAFAGSRFSFSAENSLSARKRRALLSQSDSADDLVSIATPAIAIPKTPVIPEWSSQLLSTLWIEANGIIRTPAFIVIMAAALLNTGASLIFGATEGFGLSSFPVTYKMVETIRGTFFAFLVAIITYFVGVLVWRDRDVRMHEIVGAAPVSNGVLVIAKLITMCLILGIVICMTILLSCVVQLSYGYTRLQIGVYLQDLIVIDGFRFFCLTVLAFFAHTVSPNKYVGYFSFVVLIVVNAFVWQALRIDTLLIRYGRLPTYTYSDMFGIAPYRPALIAFGVYWLLGASILIWLTSATMHRGVAVPFRNRLKQGFRSASTRSRSVLATCVVSMLVVGGWLGYQTQVLNTIVNSKTQEERRFKYEDTYSKFENLSQPKITSVKYAIDIFPESRNMTMKATQTIVNKSDSPIDTLYVNVMPNFDTTLDIPNTSLKLDDADLSMRVLSMNPPMQPGESLEMKYTVQSKTRGIENQVSVPEIVQNGTFFNNGFAPSFGYDPNRRVVDTNTRRNYKRDPVESVPPLTRECGDLCMTHYVGKDSDWVDIETEISTSEDQIAIAPGSLIATRTENHRRYFTYRVDHPSLNFYSFISAKYEVERSKFGDVDIEVYYHPEHKWNVPRMSLAIQKSLEYCTEKFGPYRHKQARIIEFPRVGTFAQAFPGTMPYSESIGFIARVEKPDDIDMVYYIVAHEMAHQWWAHQVIGARMEGATLLSETLAQYSALMIMRKEYGPDMMHKFLGYEMDRYLRLRGRERLKERPLISVDPGQGYIHYQKGSAALYYLAEMIGEDRINAALKDIIDKFAYQGPPYPRSYELVDRLRAQTPPELHYLIKDLFEDIILFANKTDAAKVVKQRDGKYLVSIDVECSKFRADEKGEETEVEMNDWLEIGAFSKPESGHRYGRLLHRERIQLTSGKHRLQFVVDEMPHKAGIDPRHLLIDRMLDDNLKVVTQESP